MNAHPVIHWFRRDLRLQDNNALNGALDSGQPVLPVFILDDAILASDQVSAPRVKLLLAALRALDTALRDYGSRLIVRRGEPLRMLRALVTEFDVTALYFNADYTPLAERRDARMTAALDIPVFVFDDVLIHAPGQVLTQAGAPYNVFTPFKRSWWAQPKPEVQALAGGQFARLEDDVAGELPGLADLGLSTAVRVPDARPEVALSRLEAFVSGPIYDYVRDRNHLQINPFIETYSTTSALSCYLRLGMLSPRQAWEGGYNAYLNTSGEARKSAETWLSELGWRDFFTHILALFPQVDQQAFDAAYTALPYRTSAGELEAWKAGQTGFPVVDAAMRQLATLGWMHNRGRMIVASFFSKHLLLDWREGERHFMRCLIDGDPAVNNGNWQWVAGTGTDAQPFFRIFNPVAQSQKFDPTGEYIRHWVPELRDVPLAALHEPWRMAVTPNGYPPPLLDLAAGRERALLAFKHVKAAKTQSSSP